VPELKEREQTMKRGKRVRETAKFILEGAIICVCGCKSLNPLCIQLPRDRFAPDDRVRVTVQSIERPKVK
jgi:hypothetical protein